MQSRHEPTSNNSFRFSQCLGSLPLKKRRFHAISTFHESAVVHHPPQSSAVDPIIPLSTSDSNCLKVGTDTRHHQYTDSGNVNILSNATGVVRPSLTGALTDTKSESDNNQNQQQDQHNIMIVSRPKRNGTKSCPSYDATKLNDALGPVGQNSNESQYEEDYPVDMGGNISKTTSTAQSRPRVHHPPLAAPKPGGCHGRTSRNNSYCRRTPCYNGSNYCKLHYQQYVVQGGADPNGTGGSAARLNSVKSDTPEVKYIQSLPPHNSIIAIEGGDNTISHYRHHQDKRYTGLCVGEIQCCATTTRGRSCAYVAATGMKYCHLHADYDTNPPPRRGGGGSSYKTKIATEPTKPEFQLNQGTAVDHGNAIELIAGKCDQLGLSLNSQYEESDTSNTLQLSEKIKCVASSTSSVASLSSLEASFQNSTANIGAGHNPISKPFICQNRLPSSSNNGITTLNNTPYPLLNSIPSDKWSQRLVLISTGPLVNHIGRVVKWGNGWITVSTQSGADDSSATELLHNRRAIELYLLPDDSVQLPLEENRILSNCGSAASLSVDEIMSPSKGCKLPTHVFAANYESVDIVYESLEEKKPKEKNNPPSEGIERQRRVETTTPIVKKDETETSIASRTSDRIIDKTAHLSKKDETENAIENIISGRTQPMTECIILSSGSKVYSDEAKTVTQLQSPLDEKYVDGLVATSENDESMTECKLVVSKDVLVDGLVLAKSFQIIDPMASENMAPPVWPPASSLESLIQVAIKGEKSSDSNCPPLMENINLMTNANHALPGSDVKLINKLEHKVDPVMVHNEIGSRQNPPSVPSSSECHGMNTNSTIKAQIVLSEDHEDGIQMERIIESDKGTIITGEKVC